MIAKYEELFFRIFCVLLSLLYIYFTLVFGLGVLFFGIFVLLMVFLSSQNLTKIEILKLLSILIVYPFFILIGTLHFISVFSGIISIFAGIVSFLGIGVEYLIYILFIFTHLIFTSFYIILLEFLPRKIVPFGRYTLIFCLSCLSIYTLVYTYIRDLCGGVSYGEKGVVIEHVQFCKSLALYNPPQDNSSGSISLFLLQSYVLPSVIFMIIWLIYSLVKLNIKEANDKNVE